MLSIKEIKRSILIISILILLSNITVFASNDVAFDTRHVVADGFEKITENQYLNLYINRKTTEIAVQDKDTGMLWYSNPPDRGEMETILRGGAMETMGSTISFTYFTENDRERTMNSYTDSVKLGQFDINKIDNGIRVNYQFGKKWQTNDYLPTIISKTTFDQFIAPNIQEDDLKFLLQQFVLVNMVEAEEDYKPVEIFGVDSEKVFRNYKIEVLSENMSDRNRRSLIQDILNKIVEGVGYARIGSVKFEDLENFIDNPTYIIKSTMLPWDRERIINVIIESGYTPEMIQEEQMKYNYPIPYENIYIFELSIEYILDGKDLIVRVPGESIKYPEDKLNLATGKRVTIPLTYLNILPYFDAANSAKEGYIVLPDGSGALINLNNGKSNYTPYKKPLYGRNYSMQQVPEYATYLEEQIYMPVFGLNQSDRGFFAIIEEGDGIADLNAFIAGMRDSYNRVYAGFNLTPHVKERITSVVELRELAINMYQDRMYSGDIQIRYKLLQGENTDYSAMANIYRDYLVDKYNLTKVEKQKDIPFFLELIGGVDRTVPVMGVQRRVVEPLTTYNQVLDVINEFKDNGVNNIVLKYSGWSQGGYKHYYPVKVNLEKELGTRADFRNLKNTLEENNIPFYPDLSLINVYETKMFDGYRARRDNARALNRSQAFIYDRFNLSTFRADKDIVKYIISPNSLGNLVNKFLKSYKKHDLDAVSLRYIGKMLNSDYKVGRTVDREETKRIIEEQLGLIGNELDIMINGGNSYTLPYADCILNMPVYSDSNVLFDEVIPFYQIVTHGYFPYSGNPINLSDRPDTYPLRLIEIGAYPYYQLSYADTDVLSQSNYDHLFSIYYGDHLDDAVSYYKEVNRLLGELQDLTIVKHEKIADRVYKTTYENGSSIIVNYNEEEVTIGGMTIQGVSYKYVKGGM